MENATAASVPPGPSLPSAFVSLNQHGHSLRGSSSANILSRMILVSHSQDMTLFKAGTLQSPTLIPYSKPRQGHCFNRFKRRIPDCRDSAMPILLVLTDANSSLVHAYCRPSLLYEESALLAAIRHPRSTVAWTDTRGEPATNSSPVPT